MPWLHSRQKCDRFSRAGTNRTPSRTVLSSTPLYDERLLLQLLARSPTTKARESNGQNTASALSNAEGYFSFVQ